MQISRLVAALQAIQAAHGEVEVWLEDPETGWNVEMGVVVTTRRAGKGATVEPGPLYVALVAEEDEASVGQEAPGHTREGR
jgi:hypothetical protein